MKRALVLLALFAALAVGVWLRPLNPVPTVQGFSVFALGTLIEVRIADPISAAEREALQTAVTQRLENFQTTWSPTRDGALAAVNRALATSSRAQIADTLAADFALAQQICVHSGGRFDPAIGQWVALWGFESEDAPRSQPPSPAQIAAARGPSWCQAQLDADTLSLPEPGARLNFGALAKGRAVGEILQLLAAAGIDNAIVNAGGDLQVRGQHPLRPWHIGIRDPRSSDPSAAIAAIDLAAGEALFSSGDYERWFEHDGTRYHHILDPATGNPARGTISATVLHPDPALADAAATALFVAGPDAATEVAQALGVRHWLLIDQSGQAHSSPALARRLQWLDDAAPG